MDGIMKELVHEVVSTEVFAVWFLIGAALVFWMQAGFAMVEAGFTRAKNTGNIIMKNLMDFCIGTVVFILIGFGLLMGEDLFGFIGRPGFDLFTSYAEFDFSSFVFNLVFCATTATIVSGAMAERTKFLSYCIYSGVISALIYPIEAHWIWGGGWLAQIGFHDFAGSCAIHMVGGISALIGAKLLGPRIGKFNKDKTGRIVKVNAFPGHSIALGALGVFILWLGWYGFNGAAATSVAQLGSIFLTTTVAPAVATVVCMIFTWIKYGKPDVSMCLNASLAGLVAITAPCDVTDAFGAIAIGAVAGLLVVFGVWLLDHVLHIDDPVGAVAVHCMNGIWGTLAVGLFATDAAPGYSIMNARGETLTGLFYGGGFELLKLQITGFAAVAAWTAVTITITFLLIKAIVGLRVDREEEMSSSSRNFCTLPIEFFSSVHCAFISSYVLRKAFKLSRVSLRWDFDNSSVSFFSAFSSISSCIILRDISSISAGIDCISVFIIAHASSTRSIALSGKNLSLIYRLERVAAAINALSWIFTPWYTSYLSFSPRNIEMVQWLDGLSLRTLWW